MLDAHVLAAISMVGNLLAYDLLGGEKGILRVLIRIVNYSIIVGLVYGLVFGLRFAIVAGIGLGTAIGLQLANAAKGNQETKHLTLMLAMIRAFSIGLASSFVVPLNMAFVFFLAVLAAGLVLPYLGFSPARLIVAGKMPSLSKEKLVFAFLLTCVLAVAIGALGLIFGGESHFLQLALKIGTTVASLSLLLGAISPVIEWHADRLPLRTIGHVGAVMFIIGFFLQAVPNLIVILDLSPIQSNQQTIAPKKDPTVVSP
jgi:hypothetical protein